MATIQDRELHLVKKALAIAVSVIEGRPGPLQSPGDLVDMKILLDRLAPGPSELEFYARAARIAIRGTPE